MDQKSGIGFILAAKCFGDIDEKRIAPFRDLIREGEKEFPELADPETLQQLIIIKSRLNQHFCDIHKELSMLLHGYIGTEETIRVKKWFCQNPGHRQTFNLLIEDYPYLRDQVKVVFGKSNGVMKRIFLPVLLYGNIMQVLTGDLRFVKHSELIIYDDIHQSFITHLESIGLEKNIRRSRIGAQFNADESWKWIASRLRQNC